MFNFNAEEMSECDAAFAITRAVLAHDEGAVVCVWIETHDVEVMSATTSEPALLEAIFGPDFPSVLLLQDESARFFRRAP